ncbi:two component transcriptional regulator, LytTR family [Soonwooa buanensis]|uniref:Two component transcriptional regulator, LytTR family n=1 Tax=Soonwooa buanensis TaxID=619805 RepID=A0A1T5EGC5_9FLAO|nr:LytTR family DNA-binding domain-containing protein [Soonwooa buanensis]SKB83004.1 two component transcriptional regulator, LytTR family [Soonwooa buanensis]
MNIKTIIIDDEPLAVSLLEKYVFETPNFELLSTFLNPIEAIEFIQNNDVDLVFLDIQMPELSGINFMKIVGDKVKYILTTAYSEFAMEGYEHNVIDYLLKPITISRFQKGIEKAKERFASVQESEKNYFFIKSSGQQYKILFDDILYIESIKDYVNVKTKNHEYIVLDTLKSMEEKLPDSVFCRVHKSYILNLNQIKSVDSKSVLLISDTEIPVGESFKVNFLKKLK